MKRAHGLLGAAGSLVLAAGLWGCDASVDAQGRDTSLRAALASSAEELEMTDLPTRQGVADRLLSTARHQVEAGEAEVTADELGLTPVDAVARVDDNRRDRGLEPLVVAVVRSEQQQLKVAATGEAKVLVAGQVLREVQNPAVRVGDGFTNELSEALGGRSESQTVEALSGALGEIGAAADPSVASWTTMRRPGLKAGLVFLPAEGIIEVNPATLYFLATTQSGPEAVGVVPATVGDPAQKPASNDWEVLMTWLKHADPASWTNLGVASATYDAGRSDTYSPSPLSLLPFCPCCWCSALPVASGPLGGLVALLSVLAPLGMLLLLRRRA